MNNTLHTPAPWKCDLVSLKIWANDGNTEIARTSSDVSISEEEANARLISAAPDLLQIVADYVLLCDLHDYVGAVPDAAREALRKAKGEA